MNAMTKRILFVLGVIGVFAVIAIPVLLWNAAGAIAVVAVFNFIGLCAFAWAVFPDDVQSDSN